MGGTCKLHATLPPFVCVCACVRERERGRFFGQRRERGSERKRERARPDAFECERQALCRADRFISQPFVAVSWPPIGFHGQTGHKHMWSIKIKTHWRYIKAMFKVVKRPLSFCPGSVVAACRCYECAVQCSLHHTPVSQVIDVYSVHEASCSAHPLNEKPSLCFFKPRCLSRSITNDIQLVSSLTYCIPSCYHYGNCSFARVVVLLEWEKASECHKRTLGCQNRVMNNVLFQLEQVLDQIRGGINKDLWYRNYSVILRARFNNSLG